MLMTVTAHLYSALCYAIKTLRIENEYSNIQTVLSFVIQCYFPVLVLRFVLNFSMFLFGDLHGHLAIRP